MIDNMEDYITFFVSGNLGLLNNVYNHNGTINQLSDLSLLLLLILLQWG